MVDCDGVDLRFWEMCVCVCENLEAKVNLGEMNAVILEHVLLRFFTEIRLVCVICGTLTV